MTPRNCPIKNRPIKCNARVVGVLSVTEEVKPKSFEKDFFCIIFVLIETRFTKSRFSSTGIL